jgi:hypothetical protein
MATESSGMQFLHNLKFCPYHYNLKFCPYHWFIVNGFFPAWAGTTTSLYQARTPLQNLDRSFRRREKVRSPRAMATEVVLAASPAVDQPLGKSTPCEYMWSTATTINSHWHADPQMTWQAAVSMHGPLANDSSGYVFSYTAADVVDDLQVATATELGRIAVLSADTV